MLVDNKLACTDPTWSLTVVFGQSQRVGFVEHDTVYFDPLLVDRLAWIVRFDRLLIVVPLRLVGDKVDTSGKALILLIAVLGMALAVLLAVLGLGLERAGTVDKPLGQLADRVGIVGMALADLLVVWIDMAWVVLLVVLGIVWFGKVLQACSLVGLGMAGRPVRVVVGLVPLVFGLLLVGRVGRPVRVDKEPIDRELPRKELVGRELRTVVELGTVVSIRLARRFRDNILATHESYFLRCWLLLVLRATSS